jgi:hypothetical protein
MSTETASGSAGAFMFDRDAEAMPRRALAALQASRVKDTLERASTRRACVRPISSRSPTSADFRSR